jgi:multiple sugar transport system permease protein
MKVHLRLTKLSLLSVPAILLLLAVLIFPLFYSLTSSLFRWSIARPFLGGTFLGLGNYLTALTDAAFLRAVFNNLLFTSLTVTIEILLGLGIAHLFLGEFFGKSLFETILFLPVVVTPVAVGVIWRILLQTDVGFACYLLSLISGPSHNDPQRIVRGLCRISADRCLANHPVQFRYVVCRAAIPAKGVLRSSLPGRANWHQRLRYLTVPSLKPVIIVVILIRIMDAFRIFDTIYILTGGGPGNATESVSTFTYRIAFQYFNTGYASALSYLTFILTVILTLGSALLFRWRKVSASEL